jgi:hypothetical protein
MRLLDYASAETLRYSGLVPAIVDGILNAETVSADIVDLARQVQTLAGDDLDELRRRGLNVVAAYIPLLRPQAPLSRHVIESLGRLAHVPDTPVTRSIINRVVAWVFGLKPHDHASALHALCSGDFVADDDRPCAAYLEAARRLPDVRDASYLKVVADRFFAWALLKRTKPRLGSVLLSEVIAPAVRELSRRDVARLESLMQEGHTSQYVEWIRWTHAEAGLRKGRR